MPAGDPGLQRELAMAYEKVGLVQGGTSDSSLGDSVGALASYKKALDIRQTLASSPHATSDDRVSLARSLSVLGRASGHKGAISSSLNYARQSVAITEALRQAEPANPKILAQLQNSYDGLGEVLSSSSLGTSLGRLVEASKIHRKAAELARKQVELNPG
jgi:hypothetical protein